MSDIVLSHISKAFEETLVLDDFSAVFPDGKITVIMAPSGRGKTTLLRILEGFEKADGGTISGLSGRVLSAAFQDSCLIPRLKAWKNIQIVNPAMTKEEIIGEMEKLSLGRCAEELAEKLSGGEKRRVSLLRALLYPADTYLLDEPFNALDWERKEEAIAYTKKRLSGRTVLLITHNLGLVAQYSKYVNVMYAGEIIERGTVPEVLGSPIHPYTQGLLAAVPRLDLPKDSPLVGIPGTVPPPTDWPSGCAFHPRCPKATEECSRVVAKSCMAALR